MSKSLSYAPELVYQSSIGDIDYFQFNFAVVQDGVMDIMFPMPIKRHVRYSVTVARKAEKEFYANIRDVNGLDFSVGPFNSTDFEEKWVNFLARMKG